MRKRVRFISARLALPFVLMMFAVAAPQAFAQDSTPGPEMDMGVCSEALGIGMAGDSCINVVHASPDAPAVDVYLDGALALEDLEFGAISGWVAVPAGEHQVQVTAADADVSTAVIDVNVDLAADAAYHVAATGLLADITPQVYQVNLSDLDAMGDPMARIRVIHTSPDAPSVDIALTGGDVLISDLAFPNASDALEVPAASYDLEVRPTGTTDVALALPGVVLEAGMVYDVFAIGLAGDGTLTVLVVPSTTAAAMASTPDA